MYTGKNASEVEEYLDVLGREWELYATQPAIAGRPLRFIYFGGGTPSFLSVRQLRGLVDRLSHVAPWTDAEEITFECEPGTLTEPKLAAIRDMGITRLSLGLEHFDDQVLELNGRAHRSAEIFRAYTFAQSLDFPQVNIDLIAGMLGDTDEKWRAAVDRTIELSPDSVTIYQMEAAVQHDDQQRPAEGHGTVHRHGGRLANQAAVGTGGLRRARAGRLHGRQRLHRREEPGDDPVRLPRPALAGRRPRGPGGRLVRIHQRRPHAEPGQLGSVRRRRPARCDSR